MNFEITIDTGITERGKYIFVISWELSTTDPAPLLMDSENIIQGTMPTIR